VEDEHVRIDIKIDGLDVVDDDSDSKDAKNQDSLEKVRGDLNALVGTVNARGKTLEETTKGLGDLSQQVAKLKDRLDTWETNGEKRRELIKRLAGMETPSNATSQRRAAP